MANYLDWLAPRLARRDAAFTEDDVENWHSGKHAGTHALEATA